MCYAQQMLAIFSHFTKTVSKQNHKLSIGNYKRPLNFQVCFFWHRKMSHKHTDMGYYNYKKNLRFNIDYLLKQIMLWDFIPCELCFGH
jgi:hypothetical protein